ncbi:protein CFAP20DC isoform X4 [Mycteria americana]|uniref:protein CFAP20DC isoform X4 n=2 Tax=Mycteria americana TaxID=33587 RepID=UPI003F58643A
MFKNQYQGGPFVEIFSAQGKNPAAKWKIFGNPSAIWKEYDKEVKGFVFVLEGSSQINKMQLPKETRQTLGLIQQFLTLQIFVPLGQDFSTELLITDLGNIKRRLYLSTVHKELSVTPLHAKIPLFTIKRKIWCNMCIDLVAFTSEIFRGAVFQSLDGISISANCKLRKIFTLKSKPQDTAEEDDMCVVPFMPYEPTDIPRTCQLNTDVPQVTQLLNLTKIHKPERKCRRCPVTVQETGMLFTFQKLAFLKMEALVAWLIEDKAIYAAVKFRMYHILHLDQRSLGHLHLQTEESVQGYLERK